MNKTKSNGWWNIAVFFIRLSKSHSLCTVPNETLTEFLVTVFTKGSVELSHKFVCFIGSITVATTRVFMTCNEMPTKLFLTTFYTWLPLPSCQEQQLHSLGVCVQVYYLKEPLEVLSVEIEDSCQKRVLLNTLMNVWPSKRWWIS